MPQLPWIEGLTIVELASRLESHYKFDCEAGPLKNCVEWIELRKRLAELAEIVPDPRIDGQPGADAAPP